ncbi:histone-lysine N-methyltransferase [Plakobranchus ocellatus]|uniref:Histone-lysine N-methyltransferase n=1 Tax=Plakobranchus ocellatus TaxID=259542 RepID=A0AAV4CER9_9GAST|nr:histone-lysine N-methyltransferase [Plakobranchus ocellatus]
MRPLIQQNLTQQWLQRYGWKILPHPAYSPDLAPSDFHLFGPLKRHLGGMGDTKWVSKDPTEVRAARKAMANCLIIPYVRKQSGPYSRFPDAWT